MFGGGVAAFDYNNDNLEDLIITGGNSQDILLKNNGDGTFKNVSIEAGLTTELTVVTTGVVKSDVNKDGYVDIFNYNCFSRKKVENQ